MLRGDGTRAQERDPIHLASLLRPGSERRGEEHRTRASEERSPLHYSIT